MADGSPDTDGQTATDGQATTGTDDSGGGSDSDSDSDGGDGSDSGDGTDTDAGDEDVVAIPGMCGIDEINRSTFYGVTNIEDDDPDGGLNVREDFDGGTKLATLAEGTAVFASDCHRKDDGAVWYFIETDEVAGWVNAAYLGSSISPLAPTFGGLETAEKVEAVLDAFAAKNWDEAAQLLTLPDTNYSPFDRQLEDGDDLADRLEAYCALRVCDAPYIITDVRGSYVPTRVSPEVDVTITYPGGVVSERFGRVQPETAFTIDALPGRSVLAYRQSLPSVADLVDDASPDDEGLYAAAEEIRQALLSETGPRIPGDYIPAEGLAISPDAYVDPEIENRNVVTKQDLDNDGAKERMWGYTDGVGSPIVESLDTVLAQFRRSLALLHPDEIGIDERVGLGNTIANLGEVFPDATVVEFHRQGRGELLDFNWSSVRIALEQRDGTWKLLAITSDTWTI